MSEPAVSAIFLHRSKEGPMDSVPDVLAEAGRGLLGDTYHGRPIDADEEATLIESEALEYLAREKGVSLDASESRRNIVTSGVSLNDLVGREFRVGEALLRGIRLCEPCSRLQRMTRPGVLKGLVHRGGLRAQIVEGGTIRVGDRVIVAAPQAAQA